MSELLVVITTLPDGAIAQEIASVLVTEGYAACVQVLAGISSTYRWQGKICCESEQILLIKTTNYPALAAKLSVLHPYEQPEIVALKADQVSMGYLQWVRAMVSESF